MMWAFFTDTLSADRVVPFHAYFTGTLSADRRVQDFVFFSGTLSADGVVYYLCNIYWYTIS